MDDGDAIDVVVARDRRAIDVGAARVTVVAAARDGVEPSLFVCASDGTEYAFQLPESLSRCALEHKIRPSGKLKACFVRDGSSASIGGLTGLVLRLSADGHERVVVVGPRGTSREVDGLRRCARFVHPKVDAVELDANTHRGSGDGIGCYADGTLTAWPVYTHETACLVCDWERWRTTTRESNSHKAEGKDADIDVDVEQESSERSSGEGDEDEHVPEVETSVRKDVVNVCVGFICEMRGLQNDAGARFAILNIKSTAELKELNEQPILRCVMDGKHDLDAIFHCSPTDIVGLSDYKSWAESLRSTNFTCRAENDLGFCASARVIVRLNAADSQSFPIPKSFSCHKNVAEGNDTFKHLGLCSSVYVQRASHAEVESRITNTTDFDVKAVLEELMVKRPELADAARLSLENLQREANSDDIYDDTATNTDVAAALKSRLLKGLGAHKKQKSNVDPEIVFLGTGSAEPNKYRGSSGILVELPRQSPSVGRSWILLDCGEGSVGAIQRLFGRSKMLHIVKHLKLIWISHHHADHMLGVRGVLEAHAEVSPMDPLTIVGPSVLKEWLVTCFTAKSTYCFVHSRELFAGPFGRLPPPPPPRVNSDPQPPPFLNLNRSLRTAEIELMRLTGLSRFEAIPVEHCRDASALVISFSTGWSLSYSGDCRPSINFAHAATGCTVMIHEATFDNNLDDHAVRKRHCTTAEALQVASDANVEHIILTHFSQRYPKAINLNSVETRAKNKPIIAFDGMRVRWSNLSALSRNMYLTALVLDGC